MNPIREILDALRYVIRSVSQILLDLLVLAVILFVILYGIPMLAGK